MDNLLAKINNNIATRIKRDMPYIKENIKRTAKVLGMGTLSVASLVGSVFNPLFLIPSVLTATNALENILYRKQKDLMFITRHNLKTKELEIYQDPVRIDLMNKIKDLNPAEKAGVMALQTLVGFQRYQKQFSNKKEKLAMESFREDSDIQVYPQKFSTRTHGINIKVLEALQDLGYISIQSNGKDDRKKLSLSKKIYKRYALSKSNSKESIEKYFDGRRRTLLTVEKLGFGSLRKGEVKENIVDYFSGNVENLESKSKVLQKINFRLTDKEIDFEELYKMTNNPPKDLSRKEKSAIGRLGIIFNNKKGILKTANIDIEKDKDGIDRIKYKTKSYADKREEEEKIANKKNEFRQTYGNQISLEQQAQDIEQKRQEKEVEISNEKSNDIEQGQE
ncbi:MAG: hypothetical protein HFJ48_06650 [Clostridia bacterium]|nr:hypothetical protein [Clostridia bacterium]